MSRLGLALWRSGGRWCITLGKMCLGLLLYCRELLGRVHNDVAEQSSLGDGSIEKAHFVNIARLNQAEQQMALLDRKCGHRLSERPRCLPGECHRNPCCAPPSNVARMGEADEPLLVIKRSRPRLHRLLMHFLGGKEPGQGMGGVHASSTMLAMTWESMTNNSGSDSVAAATPKEGSPAESSS